MPRTLFSSVVFSVLVFACSSESNDTSEPPDSDTSSPEPMVVQPKCNPGFETDFLGLEGQPINATLTCQSDTSLSDLVFKVENLPEGATFDAATKKITWTPLLNQSGAHPIVVSIDSLEESATIDLNITDAFEDPNNMLPLDPATYKEEFGLPVLWISYEPTDREFQPIEFYYRGEKLEAEARLRGASSTSYDKKSYAFKFLSQRLSEDKVADFGSRSRMVATSTFDDNSYLRQRLVYTLWNQLDPTIKLQAYSGVMYINGVFHGLYTFTDQPGEELTQRAGLAPNGNLYKAINHDANFNTVRNNGNAKTTLHDGYEKEEGNPKEGEVGAFDDLDQFVEFVALSSDDEFNAQIEGQTELIDYHKWFLLATYTLSEDSGGKNSYHYHNQTQSLPWTPFPWDFNHSFGQTWTTVRRDSGRINHFTVTNHLFTRLESHPIQGPMRDQLFRNELSQGVFHKDHVLELVSSFENETKRAAQRDWGRWQNQYRGFFRWDQRTDFTTYDEEMTYLKSWIEARWQVYSDLFPE